MDGIISEFLTYDSLNAGAYVLLNYIGQTFNLNKFRIGVTTLSLLANLMYVFVYGYIINHFYKNGLTEGFYHDRRKRMIMTIIATIMIGSIFLITYFSISKDKEICRKLEQDTRLYYLDKIINLAYLIWIIMLLSSIITSNVKLKQGKIDIAAKFDKIVVMFVVTIIICFLKAYQLKLLLDN